MPRSLKKPHDVKAHAPNWVRRIAQKMAVAQKYRRPLVARRINRYGRMADYHTANVLKVVHGLKTKWKKWKSDWQLPARRPSTIAEMKKTIPTIREVVAMEKKIRRVFGEEREGWLSLMGMLSRQKAIAQKEAAMGAFTECVGEQVLALDIVRKLRAIRSRLDHTPEEAIKIMAIEFDRGNA